MNGLLLQGEVDDRFSELDALRREVSELRRENTDLQNDLREVRRENSRAVSELRRQLGPLYGALRSLFGELDQFETAPEAGMPTVKIQIWEAWKKKLPGQSAKFIDALLVHGEMSAAQLRVAMQCRLNGVYETASKLTKLGLLNKNGGKYSLKQL